MTLLACTHVHLPNASHHVLSAPDQKAEIITVVEEGFDVNRYEVLLLVRVAGGIFTQFLVDQRAQAPLEFESRRELPLLVASTKEVNITRSRWKRMKCVSTSRTRYLPSQNGTCTRLYLSHRTNH